LTTPPPLILEAILLAAGAGRRLGVPKAALELKGRWMLPRIVSALRRGGAQRVVLVLSAPARAAIEGMGPTGADCEILNPDPEAGRTGSILCGLDRIGTGIAGVLLHPCDVPLLTPEAVARLIRAWKALPRPETMLARPVTPGGRGGHPLLVGSERLARLRAFPPDRPLRDLVHEDPARLLDLPLHGDPGPFLDVDTPEQRQLIESLLESPSRNPAD